MPYLEAFVRWLESEELSGRPDGGRVAAELAIVARRIAGGAGLRAGSKVLDLGSGTGAVAFAAADLGAAPVAVDLDVGALARGRELTASLSAPLAHAAADARALPFADGAFEASVHRSVLPYMAERERAVAEERRVLRAGGMVSCSESLGAELVLESEDPGIGRVWQGGLAAILTETDDALALSASTLESLYRESGFDEVEVIPAPHVVILDSTAAVARAFAVDPPEGVSARERWKRAGIPEGFVDEFLARLVEQAERGRPARLIASEGFLTARAPG